MKKKGIFAPYIPIFMKELVISVSDLRYFNQLDERQRRIYAALEATELGWSGVSLVCKAYKLNRKTVYKGKQELQDETLAFQKAIRSSYGKKKANIIISNIGQACCNK